MARRLHFARCFVADRFGTLLRNTVFTDRSSKKIKKSFREGELQRLLSKTVRYLPYIQTSYVLPKSGRETPPGAAVVAGVCRAARFLIH